MRDCDFRLARRAPKLHERRLQKAVPAAAGIVLLAIGLASSLASCSPGNSTRLPELSSIPRKLLSAEEQKKVVDELQRRRDTHREEAIKEIKSARAADPSG
ncbi:MAG TPA: hypothetical protein VF226_22010 [Hyphomicrobiaceae bacterium]|jgi:hypothetical protein